MITREQALALKHGDIVHCGECSVIEGPRGGKTYRSEQWRVTGKAQTWKRATESFRVPLKHGLYEFGELSHHTNHQFHLDADCPIKRSEVEAERMRLELEPLPEFSDSREEPNGPDSAYPVSTALAKALGARSLRTDEPGNPSIEATILSAVLEYEHGTAEVTDVHPGLTLEMYAAEVQDIILTIRNV